ncbi:MAG: hypothetical protein LBD93_05430 [Treponema sp.]|nr:hypothetical protein [Treponema sp.]
MKREASASAAAVVRFAVVFGGKQGIKVEVRRDRRKSGLTLAGRLSGEAAVERLDEPREGGGKPIP